MHVSISRSGSYVNIYIGVNMYDTVWSVWKQFKNENGAKRSANFYISNQFAAHQFLKRDFNKKHPKGDPRRQGLLSQIREEMPKF